MEADFAIIFDMKSLLSAFKVPSIRTPEAMFHFLNGEFRETMNEVRDHLDASLLVSRALTRIDIEAFMRPYAFDEQGTAESASEGFESQRAVIDNESLEDYTETPLMAELGEWLHKQSHTEKRSVFYDPHAFSASIGYSEKEQAMLILIHQSSRSYNDYIHTRLQLQEWHYEDSANKPSHISDDEWQARRESWEEVMPTGIPEESMLTFELRRQNSGSSYGKGEDLERLLSKVHGDNGDSAHPAVIDAFYDLMSLRTKDTRAERVSLNVIDREVLHKVQGEGFVTKPEQLLTEDVRTTIHREESETLRVSSDIFALLPQVTFDDLWSTRTHIDHNVYLKYDREFLEPLFTTINEIIRERESN